MKNSIEWHNVYGHISSDRYEKGVILVDENSKTTNYFLAFKVLKKSANSTSEEEEKKCSRLYSFGYIWKCWTFVIGWIQIFFVDLQNATEMLSIYFLKCRSDFLATLSLYKALVEKQMDRRVYALRIDGAGEN